VIITKLSFFIRRRTVYHLHSFNDLKGILENHLPPAEPEEEIALQFEQLVKPVAFAESVPITVKVRPCYCNG
jgi:hypothetical protein